MALISSISVWLSVKIKRKRFVFDRMRLFYFKEKTTTPLHHRGKTMKKRIFQWKNLFIRIFLLKWKLLKHLWEQKKIGKTYKRCLTLGSGFPTIIYGKLLVLFFLKIFPSSMSFSFFFDLLQIIVYEKTKRL